MAKIEYSGIQEIRGVFLLEKADLIELDRLLDVVAKMIDKHVKEKVQKEAEGRVESGRAETLEAAKQRVLDSFEYRDRNRECKLVLHSGKTLKGSSFERILASEDVTSEWPKQALAEIQNGPVTFELTLFNIWDSVEFKIRPSDLAFSHRIIEKVTDWVRSKRQFPGLEWLQFPSMGSMIPFFFVAATWMWCSGIGLLAFTSSAGGRDEIVARAKQLVEGGLTAEEHREATELLLRLEAGAYDSVKIVGVNWSYFIVFSSLIAICILLFTRPRPIIGIGRAQARLRRYKLTGVVFKWLFIGFLLSIPGSLCASVIWDFLKDLWIQRA